MFGVSRYFVMEYANGEINSNAIIPMQKLMTAISMMPVLADKLLINGSLTTNINIPTVNNMAMTSAAIVNAFTFSMRGKLFLTLSPFIIAIALDFIRESKSMDIVKYIINVAFNNDDVFAIMFPAAENNPLISEKKRVQSHVSRNIFEKFSLYKFKAALKQPKLLRFFNNSLIIIYRILSLTSSSEFCTYY